MNRLMKVPAFLYLCVDIFLFVIQVICDAQRGLLFGVLSVGLKLLVHLFGALSLFVVLEKAALRLQDKEYNF